jgi:hypothetical protein
MSRSVRVDECKSVRVYKISAQCIVEYGITSYA